MALTRTIEELTEIADYVLSVMTEAEKRKLFRNDGSGAAFANRQSLSNERIEDDCRNL